MRAFCVVPVLIALLVLSSQQHGFADAQIKAECEPCLTCVECGKCRPSCNTLCQSVLCAGCTEQDCFGADAGSDFCNKNCGPECTYCEMCPKCDEYCAPCDDAPCNDDTCSFKTMVHDSCDNGNQCEGDCLTLCNTCLSCSKCSNCRAECGHCDDCYEYPDSGACGQGPNACAVQCKPCESCNTCHFSDDDGCDNCQICVTTKHDEREQGFMVEPLNDEQIMRIESANGKGSSSTQGSGDGRASAVLLVVSMIGLTLAVIAGVFHMRARRRSAAALALLDDEPSSEKSDLLSKSEGYGAAQPRIIQTAPINPL